MAYCKVGASHSANALLSYCDREKDIVKDGVNCNIDNVKQEMKTVRTVWNKDDKVQVHSIIQSFDGQEVSLEKANAIGKELAEKVAPGFQAAIFSHGDSDGGNIHNHIVINSVNPDTGKKLESHGLLKQSRNVSDELCNKYELSLIKEKKAELRYNLAEKGFEQRTGKDSWKSEIREVVENAKNQSKNISDFTKYCNDRGVKAIERVKGKFTYQHPNGRKIRDTRLGDNYTKASVDKALSKNYEVENQRQQEVWKKIDQEMKNIQELQQKILREDKEREQKREQREQKKEIGQPHNKKSETRKDKGVLHEKGLSKNNSQDRAKKASEMAKKIQQAREIKMMDFGGVSRGGGRGR